MSTWTAEYDELVLHIRDRCFLNMQLQTQSSLYFQRINDVLTYPILILSAISSAALFTSDDRYLRYVSASINVLNTVLITVVRNMKPDHQQQHYAECGKRYQEMIDNLDLLNAMSHNLRPSPEVYLEKLANELSAVTQTQLQPPTFVMKVLERKFKSTVDSIMYHDIIQHIKVKIKNRLETPRFTYDEMSSIIPSTPSRAVLNVASPRLMLSPLFKETSSRSSSEVKLRVIPEDGAGVQEQANTERRKSYT
jgi:hypothetical protein